MFGLLWFPVVVLALCALLLRIIRTEGITGKARTLAHVYVACSLLYTVYNTWEGYQALRLP